MKYHHSCSCDRSRSRERDRGGGGGSSRSSRRSRSPAAPAPRKRSPAPRSPAPRRRSRSPVVPRRRNRRSRDRESESDDGIGGYVPRKRQDTLPLPVVILPPGCECSVNLSSGSFYFNTSGCIRKRCCEICWSLRTKNYSSVYVPKFVLPLLSL